jgi:hypothetical protein
MVLWDTWELNDKRVLDRANLARLGASFMRAHPRLIPGRQILGAPVDPARPALLGIRQSGTGRAPAADLARRHPECLGP